MVLARTHPFCGRQPIRMPPRRLPEYCGKRHAITEPLLVHGLRYRQQRSGKCAVGNRQGRKSPDRRDGGFEEETRGTGYRERTVGGREKERGI